MEKKFNVGGRVMCTDNGKLGVVTEIDNDGFGYVVLFDDSEDTWIECDMLELSEEPPYDPKTAFLSELKGLLEKYGAELGDSGMYEIEGMEVTFDNGTRIRYKHCTINALNVMDYDKE